MAVKQKQAFGQKESFQKKMVGIVSIVTGETKAKLTLLEENKTFIGGQKSLTVRLDDLPDRPTLKPNDKSGKQYRIRMSSDGTEVEAITPVSGVFEAELIDLGPRPEEGADPMPKEKVFDEGGPKENRHWEFFAVYKIVEGMYKGVQLPAYNLHYKFEEDGQNPGYAAFTFSLQNKQATRGKQLAEWGHLHGVWEVQGTDVLGDPIPWDDETILPELLERALEQPNVRVMIKDGYIRELLPSEETPEFMESDDVDIDDPDALDEILDEKEVEEVKIKSKAPKPNGKVKPAPKRVAKKSSDEDEDL